MNLDDKRLKRLFTSVVGGSWGEEPGNAEVDMLCIRGTDFDAARFRVNTSRAPTRAFTEREIDIRAAVSGDLIIEKSGGSDQQPVGRAVLWDGVNHVMPTNFAARLRVAAGVDPRYATYLLASMWSNGRTRAAINQTTGIQNLDLGNFLDQRISCPPPQAQSAIAAYLDRETAQIDALIAAKRRMVELEEERMQGLRKSAFSDITASEVKLGRFVASIGQGVSPAAEARQAEDQEWGVLKLSAVKRGRFVPSEHKALPADFAPDPKMVPRTGDLLVTRGNTPDLVGDVCAVTMPRPRLILCDLIYVLRLRPDLSPEYAAQALLTQNARAQLSSVARGTSQSMVKLRAEDVKGITIRVPDIETQRSIVETLNQAWTNCDLVVSRLQRSIDLLQERRQALITAAVTDQLDIPEAA